VALLELRKDPSPKELRQFAAIWFPAACAVVGWMIYRRLGVWPAGLVWGLGVVLGIIGAWRPAVMRPIWNGWMTLAWPIGWVVSHAVLGLLYYGVLTPLGLVMRLVGHDPMTRGFDGNAKTYWVVHDPGAHSKRYLRQF
jgi:hypothetical protein